MFIQRVLHNINRIPAGNRQWAGQPHVQSDMVQRLVFSPTVIGEANDRSGENQEKVKELKAARAILAAQRDTQWAVLDF